MESYNKLLNILTSQNIQNNNKPKNQNFKKPLCTSDIFDVLVWSYYFNKGDFNLISSDFGYTNVPSCDFKKFIELIKPCFQDYILKYFTTYLLFILDKKNKTSNNNYRIQGFIPVELKRGSYYYTNICILPIVETDLVGFHFTFTPLKPCHNEPIFLEVLHGRKKDHQFTNQIKSRVPVENIFTQKQADVFDLILLGYSSTKIAELLNKKKENVFRYNIRINEKLTSFFNIDFENVTEAVNYYKNCFILN